MTTDPNSGTRSYGYFNSHAHVERDDDTVERVLEFYDFNSHAHVERDIVFNGKEWNTKISTHTLTWSVTDSERQYIVNMLHFNSHAHVERDCYRVTRSIMTLWFQLTRSRGAWLDFNPPDDYFIRFQLTRSRGAWLRISLGTLLEKSFQLTRSRGAWLDTIT